MRKGIKKQLQYVRRDLKYIAILLARPPVGDQPTSLKGILTHKEQRDLLVITTLYVQQWCKERGILLSGKPLGRPGIEYDEQMKQVRSDSGTRNRIEGKFGECKRRYGLNLIAAKLRRTSESWIAAIIFVANIAAWERLFIVFFSRMFFFFKSALQNHEPSFCTVHAR